MLGDVKSYDYDIIRSFLEDMCERCDPSNENHKRVGSDRRRRAMQRRGRFEAQIMNQCAEFMWRTYCTYVKNRRYRAPDCSPAVIEATKVLSSFRPLKAEPVGFLEGWEDVIKTILTKCEDDEMEDLYKRLDTVDNWTALPTLSELLKEVLKLQEAGELSSDAGELGVLAEILGMRKIGALWNGF